MKISNQSALGNVSLSPSDKLPGGNAPIDSVRTRVRSLTKPVDSLSTAGTSLREISASLIQKQYRFSLQRRPFPKMLTKTGELKPLPRLVKSPTGSLSFGARPLTISGRSLGKGAYGNVYAGTYNNRPVALKIGRLPELRHVDKILSVKEQLNLPIVPPYPIAISDAKAPSGIAMMPRMTSDLKTYLRQHPEQTDQRRCEQYRLSSQLVDCGVYHMDQTPENFLVDDSGKLYLSDFGCTRVDRTHPEPVYAATTPIEDVLPCDHPFLSDKVTSTNPPRVKQETTSFFLDLLATLRMSFRLF